MFKDDEITKFLYWEQTSRDTIDFKKVYVDITDDLIAGLLLSQIIYWYLPSKETGKTKLRVEKDGYLWIAKGRNDWYDEIRITAKQFDRASGILERKGIIKKERFKFNGSPTVHVRLIWDNFLSLLNKEIDQNSQEANSDPVFTQRGKSFLPKGEEPIYPKGKNDITQRGRTLTESTAKNSTKRTTKNLSKEVRAKKDEKAPTNKNIEKLIELTDLPIQIQKALIINKKRLLKDSICLNEIKDIFKRYENTVELRAFSHILSTVLRETRGSIRNITGLMKVSITNYFDDMHKIKENNETNTTKEVLPDWFEDYQKKKYNFNKAQDRFNDIL